MTTLLLAMKMKVTVILEDETFVFTDSETEISESNYLDIETENNVTAIETEFYKSKDKTMQYWPDAFHFIRPIASSLFRPQTGIVSDNNRNILD